MTESPQSDPDKLKLDHNYDGIEEYDNPLARMVEVAVRRIDCLYARCIGCSITAVRAKGRTH